MLNTMLLYHVSAKNLGTGVTLFPRIPENVASGEDKTTPRICCCTNILDCLRAMVEFPYHYNDNGQPELLEKLYVYTAHVPISKITEPTIHQVPDRCMTGEYWVTEPQNFDRFWIYTITRQAHIDGTPYSRFILHDYNWDDEIVADRRIAQVVYGDEVSFSILTFDDEFREPSDANTKNIIFGDDPRYSEILNQLKKKDI